MTGLIGSRCRTLQQRGWGVRKVWVAGITIAVLYATSYSWPASARPPIRTDKQPIAQQAPQPVATPAAPAASTEAPSTNPQIGRAHV